MTIEIRFCTGPSGGRYALFRIKGWRSMTWHGISVSIAEKALLDGHVSVGRLAGALAVPATEHEAETALRGMREHLAAATQAPTLEQADAQVATAANKLAAALRLQETIAYAGAHNCERQSVKARR